VYKHTLAFDNIYLNVLFIYRHSKVAAVSTRFCDLQIQASLQEAQYLLKSDINTQSLYYQGVSVFILVLSILPKNLLSHCLL